MEEILMYLGVSDYVEKKFTEEIKCYIYNFENDKLIIAFNTNKIDSIKIINNLIPKFKSSIQELIKNPINIKDVDSKNIPLSQFLWDLYLVCFYKIGPDTGEMIEQKISDYERDRYVARKIIIKYKEKKDIKEQYEKILFPNNYIDKFEFGNQDEDYIEDNLLSRINEIDTFLNS
ncbi:hypothetical protein [Bacillus mycoides]|uniref:hypothetical protein n=1 Tax=Bacillus mycoides TaxID=1405 RepID=UPI003D64B554